MTQRVIILGCGSSGGVPRVGSGWGACDPANPRNRRRRCSILVERLVGDTTTRVLVDTSPDLREQLIDAGITRLDAVVLTHEHADHTHGIDDLRPLCIHMRRQLDIHMNAHTSALMHTRFGYCFSTPDGSDYPPIVRDHRIEAGRGFELDGRAGAIRFLPIRLKHGGIDALGLRFGDTAYTPDVNDIPDESISALENLDLWIIDALRHTRHPSHFSLGEALAWIERLRPKRAVLTNLHTDLDYAALTETLPPHVTPAYDGMVLES
jgi:phosphoribosyl 1,2-cyclic phosphate phosphodiesterase